jgi:tetratricopeptide (TPR) repeat protein
MITAIACVTLHGALLLFGTGRTRGERVAGILNLLLALSAFRAYFLFASGSLIISPEFSVILAEGTSAWFWCLATIFLIPFAVWMALHCVRASQQRVSHVSVTLPLGALCGIWTVIRASQLNPGRQSVSTIFCVDLWSGPLLAWVIICIVDWFFTVLKITGRANRTCGIAFALSYFALWANLKVQDGFVFADKYTLKFWWLTADICVPGTLVLLTWIALHNRGSLRRMVQIVASVLAGLLGLVTAVAVTVGKSSLAYPSVVWGGWIALLLIALVRHMRRAVRGGRFQEWKQNWRCPDLMTLASLALFGACMADLSHIIGGDPTWDLALLVAAWLALQESSMGYPLWRFLKKLAQATVARMRALAQRFRHQPHGSVAPAPAAPAGKGTWRVFVASLVIVVILIAIPEFFNAGKTILEPFTTNVPDSGKSADERIPGLGKAIADRTVNTLGLLEQELRPDLLISGDRSGSAPPTTMDQTTTTQAVVSGNDLQIPGTQISIPFGFFATPIQQPLRAALGVTVIQGTLQQDGGRYSLLAESTAGQMWRVDEEPLTGTCLAEPESADQPANPGGGDKSSAPVAPTQAKPGEGNKSGAPSPATPPPFAIVDQMANGLAYRIISSNTRLNQRGITSEWRAIPDFRNGLRQWQSFDRTGNYRNLSRSIDCFRAAVDRDPNFALAWYRLGLALEQDGQPGMAIDALRRSIQVNPRFVAGHLALAQALSYYDRFLYASPPSLAEATGVVSESLPAESQYDQSARLIRRVLNELRDEASLTDRAEAYLGLCRNELYFRDETFMKKNWPARAPQLMEQYRQFFYCKRAEYLYSKLSSSLRAEVRVRPNEEWVVKANGYILAHSLDKVEGYHAAVLPQDVWTCDDPLIHSYYLRFAVNYYRKAAALDPNDFEVSCGYAMTRASENPDDTAPLDELAHSGAAHVARAGALAGEADSLYQKDVYNGKVCDRDPALRTKIDSVFNEFDSALRYDPINADVLNNYAYQVYEWHLEAARHPALLEYPPPGAYALALQNAAAASRLTESGGTRIEHRVIESTIGELDLASGDPADAAKLLEQSLQQATQDHSGIEHAHFDEIRWDLAQAWACLGPDSQAKARDQLGRIFDEEKSREDQRFVGVPDDTFVDRNLQVLEANCAIFTRAAALPKTEPVCSRN